MALPIDRIGNRRSLRVITVLGTLGAACALMPVALSGETDSGGIRILTYTVQAAVQTTPTADPNCPLKQLVGGAGLTNLLGPVHDEQSDCVHPDGTIDQGVFTLTGAALTGGLPGGNDSGDSISGQYRARIVPTVGSQLTNPPGGFWLIYGEVCTWKGTGRFADVVNDCPTDTSPGRFVPARLTVDFNSNEAIAFGTMVVRFKDAE
jgi:hypothetical protein